MGKIKSPITNQFTSYRVVFYIFKNWTYAEPDNPLSVNVVEDYNNIKYVGYLGDRIGNIWDISQGHDLQKHNSKKSILKIPDDYNLEMRYSDKNTESGFGTVKPQEEKKALRPYVVNIKDLRDKGFKLYDVSDVNTKNNNHTTEEAIELIKEQNEDFKIQ